MMRPRRAACLVCLLIATLSAGAAAVAAPAVTGDIAGYNEAIAAFKRLYALPGFRMKWVSNDGQTVLMEYAPPNLHEVATLKNGNFERWVVNGETIVRGPGLPAGRSCMKLPGGKVTFERVRRSLDEYRGEVNVSRKPDAVIGGSPMHVYAYKAASGGGQNEGEVYVGALTGLPRRMTVSGTNNREATPGMLDYYDYGAKITIAPPNC